MLELQKPLPPLWVDLLQSLDAVLGKLQIPYLLAGGNAREILLVHVHGCNPGRATTDLDFGVLVADWQRFDELKAALEATKRFQRIPAIAQRMVFVTRDARLVVDLVPFGGVAAADGTLAWPPDGSTVMQVLGLEQAMASAETLRVDESLSVPIVSVEGLVMLKFVAWADNGLARDGRDAVDLFTLLRDYHEVLGLDALYEEYAAVMEACEFDDRRAGASVLGQRVAAHLDGPLRELIAKQLVSNARDRLIVNMVRGQHIIDIDGADELLSAFEDGLGV